MSSFNINGPQNRPAIQEAQNMKNNGGGGNLGYMQSGGQGKKKKAEEETPIVGDTLDSFEHEEGESEESVAQKAKKRSLFQKIKSFILKLFLKKEKPVTYATQGDSFLSLSGKKE